MKCPACSRQLIEIKLKSMTVNACEDGCAGLWFSHLGLQKVEYSSVEEGETLLAVKKNPAVQVDLNRKRNCPKCNMIMMQHFFSIKKQVTVDECPKCAGFWLDAGELATIRTEFASEKERVVATEKYFDDAFGSRLEAIHKKDQAEVERIHKIRNVLGVISPSDFFGRKK